MINSFVFEEMEKGNILSLLYIMMLCTVFINKYWKKCFFLNWQLAVKYLTHWKSNSFMNNKLNGNHPEVIVNLLHIIFLRNTVKDCIQHWFLFKPSSLYFATSCKKKQKQTKKHCPKQPFCVLAAFFIPLNTFYDRKKAGPQYMEFMLNRMKKNAWHCFIRKSSLFYHEKLSHYILTDILFTCLL